MSAKRKRMPRYRDRGTGTNARTLGQYVAAEDRRSAKVKSHWAPAYREAIDALARRTS